MIGKHLQRAVSHAVNEVRRRRHEYLTLEHLLYSIACEPHGRKIIEACGASAAVLRENLEHFFQTHLERSAAEDAGEIVQTLSVQRVLQHAMSHIQAAGREVVEIGDVLAAVMEEEDSYACYYLRRQGVTRLEVLTCISHEMEGAPGKNEPEGEGEKEDAAGGDALEKYAADLTQRAREGRIDPLVGREAELERVIEILCRRRKNNPLLVGEPGVGKTAVAEGLALRIARGEVPPAFSEVRIFSLDIGAMLAGARYRGDFEGRMKAVMGAVRRIPKAILFIDEIHTIVGAGATSGGSMDASNLLKPMLAAGELRCIGSTTHEEFRNHLEKDRALSRRFQRIDIREPSREECLEILKGLKSAYEKHHAVRYGPAVLRAAVELSARHVPDRLLPDKAIDVMDEAGAAVRLRPASGKGARVALRDIERIVARMGGVPERSVSAGEKDRLRNLERDMRAVIFGQDDAVEITVKAIMRARAGLGGENRPAGSFLFYGPTGVGKTEFARRLAALLGVAFLRYDMSEYMEKHSVSRLIGAPPGYVGFDQGGLLTEALRKNPYALVLLDEIEKAHPDVFNVLLQVMDYATLTDNTGRKADFRNVILIMTSNAGVREMNASALGFGTAQLEDVTRRGLKAVEQTFNPEFRNRLDALVPFRGLSPDLMGRIVDKFLLEMAKGLREKKVHVALTPAARETLAKKGYDPKLGARPLQRVMRAEVEDVLAHEVLFGRLTRGGAVTVDAGEDGVLDFAYAPGRTA
jgi:ATP-dependent Clp protease ATP-binding subunit ClpA